MATIIKDPELGDILIPTSDEILITKIAKGEDVGESKLSDIIKEENTKMVVRMNALIDKQAQQFLDIPSKKALSRSVSDALKLEGY